MRRLTHPFPSRALPAPLLVVGAVASVQSGAAIATRLFPAIGPFGTVWLRLGLSALLVGVVARPSRTQPRRATGLAVLFGFVLAAMNASFYLALDRIPLGIAVTVEFIGPLAVAVLGSRRAIDLLWVGLAATGVVLLASGSTSDIPGVALAAVAGGFWAAYIILAQRVGRVLPGATGLAVALAVGAVVLAPAGILAGGAALLSWSVLGRGAAVAVLSSAVPYTLELVALRRLRTSVFGVLMSLEPAMAALSGLVLLGQHLDAPAWVAIGCVTTASAGATRTARSRRVPVEPGATPPEAVAA